MKPSPQSRLRRAGRRAGLLAVAHRGAHESVDAVAVARRTSRPCETGRCSSTCRRPRGVERAHALLVVGEREALHRAAPHGRHHGALGAVAVGLVGRVAVARVIEADEVTDLVQRDAADVDRRASSVDHDESEPLNTMSADARPPPPASPVVSPRTSGPRPDCVGLVPPQGVFPVGCRRSPRGRGPAAPRSGAWCPRRRTTRGTRRGSRRGRSRRWMSSTPLGSRTKGMGPWSTSHARRGSA